MCDTCDGMRRLLERYGRARQADRKKCLYDKCLPNCKCKCKRSGSVDGNPCCRSPCSKSCPCNVEGSRLHAFNKAVGMSGSVDFAMNAIHTCDKVDMLGKNMIPLKCIERRSCTCFDDWKTEFLACKANAEDKDATFTFTHYDTVVKSAFSGYMLVRSDFKGDTYTRLGFSKFVVKKMDVVPVHWWTNQWQTYCKARITPQLRRSWRPPSTSSPSTRRNNRRPPRASARSTRRCCPRVCTTRRASRRRW